MRQPLAGNGSITVRVTSLTGLSQAGQRPAPTRTLRPSLVPWSKAGIIIKQDLSQGSAYAAMMVTGSNGVRMQWNYTGDTPGLSGAVSVASPRWLRLTRDADTITGYDSTDGAHWTQVGAVHLAGLPSTVQAGLFAASPQYISVSTGFGSGNINNAVTGATAVFDHVSGSGAWPASTWTGGYIGGETLAVAPGMAEGYHQAVRPVHRDRVRRHRASHPRTRQWRRRSPAHRVLPRRHGRRADRGDRGRDDVHDGRIPAGPDPHHARREPGPGPGAGGEGDRDRLGCLRDRAGRRRRHGDRRYRDGARPPLRHVPGAVAGRAAGDHRHGGAGRRGRRPHPRRRHHGAPQRRRGHDCHRGHRGPVLPGVHRRRADRRRGVAAADHPGRGLRRPAIHAAVPAGPSLLHARPGRRLLSARAVGRVRGAVRLGRARPGRAAAYLLRRRDA